MMGEGGRVAPLYNPCCPPHRLQPHPTAEETKALGAQGTGWGTTGGEVSTSELSAGPPGRVPLQPASEARSCLPCDWPSVSRWDMNYWIR